LLGQQMPTDSTYSASADRVQPTNVCRLGMVCNIHFFENFSLGQVWKIEVMFMLDIKHGDGYTSI
jgi:hypothetical protein